MNKKAAIDKIKKCLALSASSNEHEAETALRQAQALMAKYGIDEDDMLAAGVSEAYAKAGADKHPANWEAALAHRVADAFGCNIIFKSSWFEGGRWTFIGCEPSPEIAMYAFQVLHRQLKRQRAEHIKTKLKRCKTVTKTRRADLFCEGWVQAVAGKINTFAGSEEQDAKIDAYMSSNYPALVTMKPRLRNKKANLSDRDYNDFVAGRSNGSDAELNHGVGGQQNQGLIQ